MGTAPPCQRLARRSGLILVQLVNELRQTLDRQFWGFAYVTETK